MTNYVVIGASHAGVSFAEKMRQQGNQDPITLIDRLQGVPLQRPPLSKAYLGAQADGDAGADGDEAFYLRAPDWFDSQNISLNDGVSVTAIDRGAKSLSLSDGSTMAYDKLVLALGASARRLPHPEMDCKNVFVLRDGSDAKGLKEAMRKAKIAIVIGGGYIGLEAAASMRKHGLDVHVIEAAPRLLARVASPEISANYEALHRSHDVTMHIGVGVDALQQIDGCISGVTLADGTALSCDLLLVGIGVFPEVALAQSAELAVGNGILTDYHYQTADPDIYAIGDNVLAEGRLPLRIESIHNAQYGAHYLASRFNDAALPSEEAPWFWSDQYDRKLQSAGIVPAPDETVRQVTRPGRREGGLSVWSYQNDRLVAVESVNDPQAYMIGKLCLENDKNPAADLISDPAFDLKTLR